jgi:RimJ/RimL family protein N-acetyltransferase
VSPEREALVALLPDRPRWVELRALLLSGRGDVLGFQPDPLAAAVADSAFGSAFVLGRPAFAAMGEALALAGPSGTLMTSIESMEWVSAALPELATERAILHELGPGAALAPVDPGEVRHLRPDEVETLPLPTGLLEELRSAASGGTPIAAALANGQPVAFCYAGSVTESLWEVAIDTLEAWRRRGYAARAARFEIARFHAFGRRPVWGAVESNAASRGLAAKLGFVAVDELWIFTTPPSRPAA